MADRKVRFFIAAFVFFCAISSAGFAGAQEPQFSSAPVPQTVTNPNPAPTPAPAPESKETLDVGWNTGWSLVFGLENIFQNNAILNSYGGGIGIQKNFDPETALRIGIGVSRTSDPAYVAETTSTIGGTTTTTKTFVAPGGPTSTLDLSLSAAILKRFTTGAFSAFLGGGLGFAFSSTSRSFADDVSVPNQTTTVADSGTGIVFGVQGLLGIDWRVAKSISLYVEYGLDIGIVTLGSSNTSTTIAGAAGTSVLTSTSSQTRVFDLRTGLVQGATLGVLAHF